MAHGKQIAGYRVLARIGEGAASELYAVQHPRTKQVWALKHVEKRSERDQRFLDQVQQEYRIGSKLDHPSIRAIYKLIKHRRRFKVCATSLVMELVDGSALDKRPLASHREAVDIFFQVARGLAHMHGRGFIHADMKPGNVLVTEGHKVKVIDLGQACAIGTVKKRIQGTPGYMAPEQAHRQAITPKTDIYNFGATMYWVLVKQVVPTALPPKDEGSSLYSGTLDARLLEAPTPPHVIDPQIHPLLSKQIMDCVQIHPDDRPETMELVANRLELIGDLLETPLATNPAPAADGKDASRKPRSDAEKGKRRSDKGPKPS